MIAVLDCQFRDWISDAFQCLQECDRSIRCIHSEYSSYFFISLLGQIIRPRPAAQAITLSYLFINPVTFMNRKDRNLTS